MIDSLTPGFIAASAPLGDPNFDRAVVMLVLHNNDGAFGFVINRGAPLTVGELLAQAGYSDIENDSSPVWIGGPVQPRSGWLISNDPELEVDKASISVGKGLRVSASRYAFDRAAYNVKHGSATIRQMVVLGYSGWGPAQLETEVARGAWLPTPICQKVLFETPSEKRWSRTYALLGITPTHTMSMRHIGEA